MRFAISTRGELEEHCKVDHRGTRFECDGCGCEGTQRTSLGWHMEAEHGAESAQGECAECDLPSQQKES